MRLGVFVDVRCRPDGDTGRLAADSAVVRFVAGLGAHPGVDRVVLFARVGEVPEPVLTLSAEEAAAVEVVGLTDYPSLAAIGDVARAVVPSRAAWTQHLGRLDAVVVFGPHPFGLLMARDARRRGVPVVLGVRQHLPAYLAPRAGRRARPAVLAAAHGLEAAWRRLARTTPVVVTGPDLAAAYRRTPALADVTFSLVGDEDRLDPQDWRPDGATVLSVGRLDPEKHPLLLLDVAEGLRAAWPGWRLRIVGDGSLRGRLADEVARRGLDHVELVGAVPAGAALRAEYAKADAVLHVSRTEGQPQVLVEAMAAARPVVATDVGGVRAMTGAGERGLLIPPDNAPAAVAALERLRADADLRGRLVTAGSAWAGERTMARESARVVELVERARR